MSSSNLVLDELRALCHLSYKLFVLQVGENFICPTAICLAHNLSYIEETTSFLLNFVLTTFQLYSSHQLSYREKETLFVLQFNRTRHYLSYRVQRGDRMICPTIDNTICSKIIFKKLNLISFYLLNNML